ncbi:MAG: tyrosine-type recombinase/integrase, partial [Ferrovibrio sp.]
IGLRNTYMETPRKANLIIQVASILGSLAVDLELRESNPAARIKKLKTGPGHRPWEEFEIEAYYAKWTLGTPQRAAVDLLLFGGQRRGDTIAMTRAHYRLEEFGKEKRLGIFVAQEKTDARLCIPAADKLIRSLDAYLPLHDQMTLLVDPKTGKPFQKRSFSGFMRESIAAAGLPDSVSVHGARYTAATRLWEILRAAGHADDMAWQVVGSITGHETVAMARKYTSKRRLAILGIAAINAATG